MCNKTICKVIFLAFFATFYISCGSETYKNNGSPLVDFKNNENYLIVGEDEIPYNTCSMFKENEDRYIVLLSGKTKEEKTIHLNLYIKYDEGKYSIIDEYKSILLDGEHWLDFEIQEFIVEENSFSIVIESNELIKANCDIINDSEFPSATVNEEVINSNISCSAYQTADDEFIVSSFIGVDEDNQFIINYSKQNNANRITIVKSHKEGHHSQSSSFEIDYNILNDILSMNFIYEPYNTDEKYIIEIKCKLGKNMQRI